MKVAVLGATRGMGRALARLMAARGDAVFLLGRDERDLQKSARDLEVRAGKGRVGVAVCDLERPEEEQIAQFEAPLLPVFFECRTRKLDKTGTGDQGMPF